MTRAEMEALPEMGQWDVVVDPDTGQAMRVRQPLQFLVSDDDVLFYTDPQSGERWTVGVDTTGKRWKMRWLT